MSVLFKEISRVADAGYWLYVGVRLPRFELTSAWLFAFLGVILSYPLLRFYVKLAIIEPWRRQSDLTVTYIS